MTRFLLVTEEMEEEEGLKSTQMIIILGFSECEQERKRVYLNLNESSEH